jgi:hypothetical protein
LIQNFIVATTRHQLFVKRMVGTEEVLPPSALDALAHTVVEGPDDSEQNFIKF